MKNLQSEGFIYVKRNGESILTDISRKQSIQILERHAILLQLFTLFGIPSNIAKKDAYKVEHVIQRETFLKIKEFLDKQY